MALTIPIGAPAASAPQAGGLRIRLPFTLFGGEATPVASERDQRVLRAVAAAAASEAPGEALARVKLAKDDPAAVVREQVINQAQVKTVVDAVNRAIADRGVTRSVSELDQAAARAVGAEPELVAVAREALGKHVDPEGAGAPPVSAVRWVAAMDATLLERPALVGARHNQFAKVTDHVSSLEQQVTDLRTKLQALQEQFEQKFPVAKLPEGVGYPRASGPVAPVSNPGPQQSAPVAVEQGPPREAPVSVKQTRENAKSDKATAEPAIAGAKGHS